MSNSRRELRDPDANTEQSASERVAETVLSPLHLRTPSRRLSMDHSRFRPTTAPPRHVHRVHTRGPGRAVLVRVPSLSLSRSRSPLSRGAADNLNPFQRALSRTCARAAYLCGISVCTWELGTEFSLERREYVRAMRLTILVHEKIRPLYGLCRGGFRKMFGSREGSLPFFVACDDKSEPVSGTTFTGLNFNLYRDGIRFPSSVAYVTVD